MGIVFTTALESIDGTHTSLFESKDEGKTWTIREQFKDKNLLTRIASVIDLKRQVRDTNQNPIGWNVCRSFVPKFDKLTEVEIQVICEQQCGTFPNWPALYHDPSIGKFVDRPHVRVHRLCVSKEHLELALGGNVPIREQKRNKMITCAFISYNYKNKN